LETNENAAPLIIQLFEDANPIQAQQYKKFILDRANPIE